jgi:hypothetical protein
MSNFSKIYQFENAFPKTGEHTVQILRHGNPATGVKLASEATDYIKNVVAEPGKTIILVLAMSAGEIYGANRNNDAFAEKPVPGRVKAGETLPEHCASFVTDGHVFKHHANKDVSKSCGDILKAFYNWTMHRVELLLRVDNIKAADIIAKIDAGEYPAVSMGCRIKFDVCDICENKAATRADYCDHMKYTPGELLQDGRKCFVWNPSPKLFDLSFVFRGADKIAGMMRKVANDVAVSERVEITSAELGEKVAALDLKMAAAKKLADMTKQVKGEPVETSNMAKAEEMLNRNFAKHDLPDILENRPEFNEKTLDSAAGEFSTEEILSTMHRMGLDPTAGETTSLIAKKLNPGMHVPPEVKVAADIVSEALIHLAAHDPVLTNALEQLPWTKLSAEHFSQKLADQLQPWMEKRSNLKRFLYMNAMPEPLRPNEPGQWDQVQAADPMTGQSYNTTRGAADAANNANTKRQLATAAGIGGLSALGYKVTKALGHPYLAAGIGGLGALAGNSMWNLQSVPDLQTNGPQESHLTVPMNSEMRKMSGMGIPAAGLATAALITLLGQEHKNATNNGDLDSPGRKRTFGELAAAHPALAFISGLLLLAAGHAALSGGAEVPAKFASVNIDDSVSVPELDIMKFAQFIGEGIIALSEVVITK